MAYLLKSTRCINLTYGCYDFGPLRTKMTGNWEIKNDCLQRQFIWLISQQNEIHADAKVNFRRKQRYSASTVIPQKSLSNAKISQGLMT